MSDHSRLKAYSVFEERLNIYSHAAGLVLSIFAFLLLWIKYSGTYPSIYIISTGIFGVSLIILYAASTFYHSASNPTIRYKLNIVDHASIYVLIAGSYTPFSLISLGGTLGWWIFGIVWGLALAGIILKLFFTGRYRLLSTGMYIGMGWIVIFAIKPLIENMSLEGLLWLFGGGLFYTLGAVFFSISRIPNNHAIFHFFVLGGSICHFIAVYYYLSPGSI